MHTFPVNSRACTTAHYQPSVLSPLSIIYQLPHRVGVTMNRRVQKTLILHESRLRVSLAAFLLLVVYVNNARDRPMETRSRNEDTPRGLLHSLCVTRWILEWTEERRGKRITPVLCLSDRAGHVLLSNLEHRHSADLNYDTRVISMTPSESLLESRKYRRDFTGLGCSWTKRMFRAEGGPLIRSRAGRSLRDLDIRAVLEGLLWPASQTLFAIAAISPVVSGSIGPSQHAVFADEGFWQLDRKIEVHLRPRSDAFFRWQRSNVNVPRWLAVNTLARSFGPERDVSMHVAVDTENGGYTGSSSTYNSRLLCEGRPRFMKTYFLTITPVPKIPPFSFGLGRVECIVVVIRLNVEPFSPGTAPANGVHHHPVAMDLPKADPDQTGLILI